MGRFSNIKEAEVYGRNPYIEPGEHTFEILDVKCFPSRNKGDIFLVELKCEKTVTGAALDGTPAKPMRIGAKYSWMQMLNQDSAMGNIKGFVAAAADIELDEVDEAGLEEIVKERTAQDPPNPLKGVRVECTATAILTVKEKKPFTAMQWETPAAKPAQPVAAAVAAAQ